MEIKKVIKLQTPMFEYLGYNCWEVGNTYPDDPKRRVIGSIEKIKKTGEMAYVDWFEIRDVDGNVIGEVRAGCLESIMYDESEDK